ncbi:hypothetical protein ACA910_001597 [Epithemia clementina (nom. ined.)]
MASACASAYEMVQQAAAAATTQTLEPPPPTTLDDIPDLVHQIMGNTSQHGNQHEHNHTAALKRIYQLCDVNHKPNRVPMVCSTKKYNVLVPLAHVLWTQPRGEGRRLACLALNNLSVPLENKRVMALGPESQQVLGGLCQVLAEQEEEQEKREPNHDAYLCCICLMNLAFLKDAKTSILQYSPPPSSSSSSPLFLLLLDNPNSMLRVLERLFVTHSAAARRRRRRGVAAAPAAEENVLVQWASGLVNQLLVQSEENAALLVQTNIPKCVVENLMLFGTGIGAGGNTNTTHHDIAHESTPCFLSKSKSSSSSSSPPPPLVESWEPNSLPDFSLFILLHLAQWPRVSHEALERIGAGQVLSQILFEAPDDLVARIQKQNYHHPTLFLLQSMPNGTQRCEWLAAKYGWKRK